MKAKRILSFLIVFTMILSSVGITGFASETSVADGFGIEEDGNVVESASAVQDFIITMYYEMGITATYTYEVGTEATLAGCIDDVFDDNFDGGLLGSIASIEIDINADMEITEPIVIPTGKTAVLDLNGHTMTYNSTTQGEAMITNKGTLTINDSSDPDTGVIYYNYTGVADSTYGKGNYTISNGGTLTVNGGKITIADLRAHAKYPIDNNSTTGDAILVINDGHLYNYNTSAIRQFCNSTTNKNSVTINGGLIEGYCAIWVQNPGSKTVNGSLSITNGEIKSTAAAYVNGTSELKDVSSEIYFSIDGEGGAWSEDSAVSITGGTINENVYLAEEAPAAITVDKTNAKFNGKVEIPAPATPVAAIGDTTFTSLHEALTIAKAGETVELISDVDLSGTEWEPVSFKGKFNGNGYKIKNLTINKPDISYVGFITSLNSVFENVTFENATVTGGENTGVVAGTAGGHAALAKDITVTGIIKVETTHSGYARAGMIVGGWAYGNYENITVDGIDKAQSYIKHTGGGDGRYVAGIVGHADDVTSYKNCTVKNITISGGWLCGGISGPGPADGLATGCTVENVDVDADYSGGMFGWYYGNGTIEDSTVKEVTFVGGSTNNGAIGGYSNNTEAIINNVTIENVKNADGKPLLSDVAAVTSKDNKTVVYSSLEEAFTAALDGETITLLADVTPTLTSQRAITKASVIDLGGKTLTLTEDDLYFGTTTFKNGKIVVDPSVKASTAVFWMFANQTLTFDDVEIIATGVTGTYLIGNNGGTGSAVNLVNGSKITIANDTTASLTAVICDNGTGNTVTIEDSTIDVKNIDGRFYLGGNNGNVTVADSTINAVGVKEGFYLRAGQTLSIEGTSTVDIELNDTNGRYGINITDETATYIKADTATVNASDNKPAPAAPVAAIGDATFASLDEALTAASAMTGDVTIEILDKVTLNKNLSGAYSSINFVGKTETAEIYLDVEGYITATGKNVSFTDLILSKSEGGFITNAGFMNVAFGIYDVPSVTYTNCTFANGAYASSGNNTFTNCTFKRSHDKYGLWAYGDADIVVDDCTFADYRGIKMYAEGAAKTTNLTVKNTDFSAVNDKPAIVLTYGESVVLENNTYSLTGVFELDLDGAPNGTLVTSDVAPTCKNDNGACGVLIDGKIYTTVAQAAEVATSESKVTLLHDSTETVEFPIGVTLDKNGYTAAGVTVKVAAVAKIGNVEYDTLKKAITAAQPNDTIILLADVTEDVSVDKSITIDGGNFKYTGNINASGNTSEVIVKNVNFVNGTGYAITTNRIKSITVEYCTVNNYGYGFLYSNKSTPTVVVKNVTVDGGNYGFHWVYGTSATLENVTMTNVKNGLLIQNYAAKTVTLKNCNLTNINVWERDGYSGIQTFKFEGNNTVSTLSDSQYAKYALAVADATLTAPEGFDVTTDLEDYFVKYLDGTYKPVKKVAIIGDAVYETLQAAVEAAVVGDTITMLSDVTLTEDVTLPAGIIFNGNGKTISGNIFASGDLTFEGYTKVTTFNAGYNKPTITIGEGATLETTSGRMVIGHGATFNITGSVADAKTADATSIIPSLIAPGASFTGAGVNFNVTNAYIKFTAYCSSKNSNANNTFNINVNNSIWEQTGSLVFTEPTNGKDPIFNFTVKDSVLDSTSHLVFAVTKGEIVIDNSLVNDGEYRQLENRSNLTIKNGSVVYASVQISSNAKNPGTTTVDNSTYVTTGTFGGADVGTGTLILQNNAKVTTGTLAKVNVTVDGTSLLTATNVGDTTTVAVDGSALEVGNTVKVIDLSGKASIEDIVTVKGDGVVATYGEDGDVTITKQEVVVETPYGTLTNAYTSETGYWGECGGNAKESFEFKFYNNDTYMGYTKLNNIGGIINGNVYVSWNIMLDAESNTDEYWDMAWEIAPTIDMQANRVEQWVDGVKVAECAIEPNWSDSIFPVVAAVTDENGKILSYVNNHLDATLENAIANGGNVVLLKDISLTNMITVPANTSVTLNLNGKTITGTDTTSKNFSIIDNCGELTVTGNGKMTLTATIDSDWNRYSAVIANNPGGKLVIENGTIEHLGGTDMAYGIDNLTNGKGTYAETIVNGGNIKSTYRGIRQFLNGVEADNILTINGGTIEGANKAIWMQDPNKNANSGKLTISENAAVNGNVYLSVTEGSTEWPVEVSIAASAVNGEVLSANVPEGYEIVKENGCYGVVEKTVVTESPFKDAPLFLAGIDNEVVDGITYHPVYIATSIDSLNYQKVGFDYTFTIFDPETNEVTFTAPYTTETTDVYESISDSTTTYTVESIGGNGSYLFMNKLWFDAEYYNNDNTKITITPYAYDMNGNKITGWTIDMTNEYYKSLQTGNVKQDMFKEVK